MMRKYYQALSNIFFIAVIALAPVVDAATGLENPLNSSFSTIPAFIAGALKVLVMVALPIITLFLVISGFMFVLARGNSSKLEEAKKISSTSSSARSSSSARGSSRP